MPNFCSVLRPRGLLSGDLPMAPPYTLMVLNHRLKVGFEVAQSCDLSVFHIGLEKGHLLLTSA